MPCIGCCAIGSTVYRVEMQFIRYNGEIHTDRGIRPEGGKTGVLFVSLSGLVLIRRCPRVRLLDSLRASLLFPRHDRPCLPYLAHANNLAPILFKPTGKHAFVPRRSVAFFWSLCSLVCCLKHVSKRGSLVAALCSASQGYVRFYKRTREPVTRQHISRNSRTTPIQQRCSPSPRHLDFAGYFSKELGSCRVDVREARHDLKPFRPGIIRLASMHSNNGNASPRVLIREIAITRTNKANWSHPF